MCRGVSVMVPRSMLGRDAGSFHSGRAESQNSDFVQNHWLGVITKSSLTSVLFYYWF